MPAATLFAAACNAVVQMMGIPRHGGGMTRINVGTLRAGEGRNVIPSSAHMALEVRGETSSINDYMVENVKNIVEGIAKGFDVSYEISQMGAVDFTNDKELSDMLIEVAKTVPGSTTFVRTETSAVLKTFPFSVSVSRLTAVKLHSSFAALTELQAITRDLSTLTKAHSNRPLTCMSEWLS